MNAIDISILVAILGILGAIIYPAYVRHNSIFTLTCDNRVIVNHNGPLFQQDGVIQSSRDKGFNYRLSPGEVCIITRKET